MCSVARIVGISAQNYLGQTYEIEDVDRSFVTLVGRSGVGKSSVAKGFHELAAAFHGVSDGRRFSKHGQFAVHIEYDYQDRAIVALRETSPFLGIQRAPRKGHKKLVEALAGVWTDARQHKAVKEIFTSLRIVPQDHGRMNDDWAGPWTATYHKLVPPPTFDSERFEYHFLKAAILWRVVAKAATKSPDQQHELPFSFETKGWEPNYVVQFINARTEAQNVLRRTNTIATSMSDKQKKLFEQQCCVAAEDVSYDKSTLSVLRVLVQDEVPGEMPNVPLNPVPNKSLNDWICLAMKFSSRLPERLLPHAHYTRNPKFDNALNLVADVQFVDDVPNDKAKHNISTTKALPTFVHESNLKRTCDSGFPTTRASGGQFDALAVLAAIHCELCSDTSFPSDAEKHVWPILEYLQYSNKSADAVVQGPPDQSIVFLDEPGQNLGAVARAVLHRHLKTVAKEKGLQVFIITHHIEMLDPLRLPLGIVRLHKEQDEQVTRVSTAKLASTQEDGTMSERATTTHNWQLATSRELLFAPGAVLFINPEKLPVLQCAEHARLETSQSDDDDDFGIGWPIINCQTAKEYQSFVEVCTTFEVRFIAIHPTIAALRNCPDTPHPYPTLLSCTAWSLDESFKASARVSGIKSVLQRWWTTDAITADPTPISRMYDVICADYDYITSRKEHGQLHKPNFLEHDSTWKHLILLKSVLEEADKHVRDQKTPISRWTAILQNTINNKATNPTDDSDTRSRLAIEFQTCLTLCKQLLENQTKPMSALTYWCYRTLARTLSKTRIHTFAGVDDNGAIQCNDPKKVFGVEKNFFATVVQYFFFAGQAAKRGTTALVINTLRWCVKEITENMLAALTDFATNGYQCDRTIADLDALMWQVLHGQLESGIPAGSHEMHLILPPSVFDATGLVVDKDYFGKPEATHSVDSVHQKNVEQIQKAAKTLRTQGQLSRWSGPGKLLRRACQDAAAAAAALSFTQLRQLLKTTKKDTRGRQLAWDLAKKLAHLTRLGDDKMKAKNLNRQTQVGGQNGNPQECARQQTQDQQQKKDGSENEDESVAPLTNVGGHKMKNHSGDRPTDGNLHHNEMQRARHVEHNNEDDETAGWNIEALAGFNFLRFGKTPSPIYFVEDFSSNRNQRTPHGTSTPHRIPTILAGPSGAGKTTILYAIELLVCYFDMCMHRNQTKADDDLRHSLNMTQDQIRSRRAGVVVTFQNGKAFVVDTVRNETGFRALVCHASQLFAKDGAFKSSLRKTLLGLYSSCKADFTAANQRKIIEEMIQHTLFVPQDKGFRYVHPARAVDKNSLSDSAGFLRRDSFDDKMRDEADTIITSLLRGNAVRAQEAMQRIGSARFKELFCQLSGGEQDAVLIAVALSFNLRGTLLLDEPGQNLDAAARSQLRRIIHRALRHNSELSIIIVTHHVEILDPNTLPAGIVYISINSSPFNKARQSIVKARSAKKPTEAVDWQRLDSLQIYFAEGVILVEGKNDVRVLSTVDQELVKLCSANAEHPQFRQYRGLRWHVFECGGKETMAGRSALCADLEVNCVSLGDLDAAYQYHSKKDRGQDYLASEGHQQHDGGHVALSLQYAKPNTGKVQAFERFLSLEVAKTGAGVSRADDVAVVQMRAFVNNFFRSTNQSISLKLFWPPQVATLEGLFVDNSVPPEGQLPNRCRLAEAFDLQVPPNFQPDEHMWTPLLKPETGIEAVSARLGALGAAWRQLLPRPGIPAMERLAAYCDKVKRYLESHVYKEPLVMQKVISVTWAKFLKLCEVDESQSITVHRTSPQASTQNKTTSEPLTIDAQVLVPRQDVDSVPGQTWAMCLVWTLGASIDRLHRLRTKADIAQEEEETTKLGIVQDEEEEEASVGIAQEEEEEEDRLRSNGSSGDDSMDFRCVSVCLLGLTWSCIGNSSLC